MSRAVLFAAALAVSACGTRAELAAPTGRERGERRDYAVTSRPADGPLERAMVAALPVTFDRALDCVAAGLSDAPGELDPRRYRHALPVECGSPLLVIDARVVTADTLAAAMAAIGRLLPGADPIALGTAELDTGGTVVVAARRTVVLSVPRVGATRLAGELEVAADALRLYQATHAGVAVREVPLVGRRFEIDVDPVTAAGADLELAIVVGRSTGPVARVRLGEGARIVETRAPSLPAAVAAARSRLGSPPLVAGGEPGDCATIPPQIDGIDISDRARCIDLWSVGAGDLNDESSHRPLVLASLLEPEAASVQYAERAIGPAERGVAIRVLRRFAVMTPADGRAQVLALLRRRWPELRERPTPTGALAAVLDQLAARPDEPAMFALKPRVDAVAARWTTTREYYSGLATSRDLEAALQGIAPEVVPTAVDLAFAQARGADGAMRHLVAFVLELPAGA